MSRIGKKAVTVPGGVTATVNGQEITVKGPKGELKHVLADAIVAKLDKGYIEVAMRGDTKDARAMWGMSRTMVANLVAGVTDGFTGSSTSPASATARQCRARTSSCSSAIATT